jgi:hypothetical protein
MASAIEARLKELGVNSARVTEHYASAPAQPPTRCLRTPIEMTTLTKPLLAAQTRPRPAVRTAGLGSATPGPWGGRADPAATGRPNRRTRQRHPRFPGRPRRVGRDRHAAHVVAPCDRRAQGRPDTSPWPADENGAAAPPDTTAATSAAEPTTRHRPIRSARHSAHRSGRVRAVLASPPAPSPAAAWPVVEWDGAGLCGAPRSAGGRRRAARPAGRRAVLAAPGARQFGGTSENDRNGAVEAGFTAGHQA